jgi:hypothetical protein
MKKIIVNNDWEQLEGIVSTYSFNSIEFVESTTIFVGEKNRLIIPNIDSTTWSKVHCGCRGNLLSQSTYNIASALRQAFMYTKGEPMILEVDD